ncbi:MAG: DUF2339 domain-containing protein, partial [Rariglobus sp.]
LAVAVLSRTVNFYFSGALAALAFAVAAFAVLTLTRWPGIRAALEASWVLWTFALVGSLDESTSGYLQLQENTWFLTTAVVIAWGAAIVLSRSRDAAETVWWRRRQEGVQTLLATLLTCVATVRCYLGNERIVALIASLAMVVLILRIAKVRTARHAAIALGMWLACLAAVHVSSGDAEGFYAGFIVVGLAAIALLALPLVVVAGPAPVNASGRSQLRWFFGASGLGLIFYAGLSQQGPLLPYVTVIWGLASIVAFMTGLFARSRPHRLLGLIGLALCVPRVFIVDLDSTLHRIAAFVVLGLVLLWVGFSYHRFRHLITETPTKGTNS